MNAITPTQTPALPRLNEAAPDFDALTTHGRKSLVRLSRQVAGAVLASGRFHARLHHGIHGLRPPRG
jgi:hypothetical protein